MKQNLLIIGLLWSSLVFSQEKPEFKASLSLGEIKIGEQTILTLSFKGSSNDTVKWINLTDTLSASVEIVQKQAIDTIYDSLDLTKKKIQQNLVLTSFDSGVHVIKPQVIYVNGIPYETQAMLLEVTTLPVDTTKGYFDIKSPYDVKYTFLDWFKDNWMWVSAGFIIVMMLVLGILWYLRYRRNRALMPQPEIKEPVLPAHIRALQKLQEIRAQKLWQNGDYKLYYSGISDVLRAYLEERFQIPAMEQTTFEIMQHLRYASISNEVQQKLKQVLTLADLVKFAKEKPLPNENEWAIESAMDVIEQTIKPEIPRSHA